MSVKSPTVLRNSIANWSAFLVNAAISFVLSPFIVHRLGDSAYGIWVLLGSVVGYLGLLDLGVRGAVTRFIAAFHAKDDHRGASATVSASLRLFTLLGCVAIAASIVLAMTLDRAFHIPREVLAESRVVVLLGGLTIAISFVGGVFGGVVAGLHRFDLDGGVEVAITIVRAAAIAIALQAGFGLVALSVIQLGVSALRGMVAFVLARRLYPALSFLHAGGTRQAVGQLLSFSLFASLIHFSGLLIYQAHSLVIGAFLPVSFVTFYAIAGSLSDYARQLVSAVSRIVTPRASAQQASGGAAAVRDIIISVAPSASLITIPIAITFMLRGERFINLWMGPSYGPLAAPVLSLLAASVWLSGGRMIAVATIMGMNRHRVLAAAMIGEAITNVALSITLIGRLGLQGVALATLIPSVAVTMVFIPWFLQKELQIGIARFLTRVWLRPSLACAAFAAATYAVERWLGATSVLDFFLQTAALLPLVPVGAAVAMLSRQERAAVRARLSAVFQRAAQNTAG